MKFIVTMKDPDTLHDSINDAVKESVKEDICDPHEQEAVAEVRANKIRAICTKWFECGEYLTVEIDTDAETCVVVPSR
jgi:hypothetical protein